MSAKRYVIEKNGICITHNGDSFYPEEGLKFNTFDEAEREIAERGLDGYKPKLYVFNSYKINEDELPNLRELSAKARNMSQENFDNMLLLKVQEFKKNLIELAQMGELGYEYELDIPPMEHDKKVALCKTSEVITQLSKECEKINAYLEVTLPKKESKIRFICSWGKAM